MRQLLLGGRLGLLQQVPALQYDVPLECQSEDVTTMVFITHAPTSHSFVGSISRPRLTQSYIDLSGFLRDILRRISK